MTFPIRKNTIEVFIIAFSILFLEILYFKTTIYIRDYLNAILVVSYALVGLGAGALVSTHYDEFPERLISSFKIILIASIILAFLNFIFLPSFLFFSPFLILPFAAGNIIISYYLKQDNAHHIYFADLAGAALGVLFSVIFIPFFREENCFIFILILLLLSLILNHYKNAAHTGIILLAAAIASGLMWFNINSDLINFAKITRCTSGVDAQKIFCWSKDLDIQFSRGSNLQRVEAYKFKGETAYKQGNVAQYCVLVAFDGFTNDAILPFPHHGLYPHDPRVIDGLVVHPEFLIIGTSAEGIIKYASLQDGKITGIEINPQIVQLMQGPMYEFSQHAYALIDNLYTIDARTFLENNYQKYDIITLMNAHLTRNAGMISAPEYLHTAEAFNSYLDHLSENGFIAIEERLVHDEARDSVYRVIHTLVQVLRGRGIQDPEKHIFVYKWIFNGLPDVFISDEFAMIVVKKTAYTPADWDVITTWMNNVEGNPYIKHDLESIYPVNEKITPFSEQINSTIKNSISQKLNDTDFSLITDDKPFPWAIEESYRIIIRTMVKAGSVCMVLLLAVFWWGRKKYNDVFTSDFLMFSLYFGLIGLAYFIIEIALINFYQIYTGSPTYSFIFILAALLLSSGIGSYVSGRLSKKKALYAFIGILLFCAYHLYINRQLIPLFNLEPQFNSLMIAISIFPLGFCMGVPFPYGIELIKQVMRKSHTGLFYSINLVFSTFAIILSVFLSVEYGFKITFTIGIVLYFIALSIVYIFKTYLHPSNPK